MTDAVLKVVHAGPHVTVQDGGRPGFMRFGVPASGPMDRKSFAIANVVLGNAPRAPGIEVSRGGLVLDCVEGAVTLAAAGGGFIVEARDARCGSWHVLTLSAGERLTVRPGPWGSWTYLAFAAGLEGMSWLGSLATHGPSGLGGGRLARGGVLALRDARVLAGREGPIVCPVWARPRHEVHVVMGPQERFFAPEVTAAFTSRPFRLSDSYDRMGVRLRGPILAPEGALAIPSEPILRGSVQVSGDGGATVLLADHQTTGGYPKIATMLSDDTDAFSQLRPHDAVAFRPVSAAEAVSLARQRARVWNAYLETIALRAIAGV